jgi:hypothetical protein
MLKVSQEVIDQMERRRPGMRAMIEHYEVAMYPPCPHCQSDHVATVQVGVIGRTINLSAATTKFKLLANGPKARQLFLLRLRALLFVATGPSVDITPSPRRHCDRAGEAMSPAICGLQFVLD